LTAEARNPIPGLHNPESGRPDPLAAWIAAAERRYLGDMTRRELARALRALSSCYVERRHGLTSGAPLASAGKRAAFAIYYAPLHFMVVRAIADRLTADGSLACPRQILDLGCGTGAAGAALALTFDGRPTIDGYDVNPWAVREARFTYRALGLVGRAHVTPIDRAPRPARPALIVAAFVVNELAPDTRLSMRDWFLQASDRGHQVLVVEPIARRPLSWWGDWQDGWDAAGGHAQEWRFAVDLPPLLRDLDQATGLRHRELTARTLLIGAQT
jgi:hypothetical protein